ncbi:hypothetical protein, partial [uncultured Vibrio sp.]|uniref:hypothetical protein n=1 Tax=uncultured Vibrio sp. TaxID=114054 RepID=UPI002605561A
MMELFSLPHHGHIAKTIRRLKKRSGHAYQHVSLRGEWVCLYGSDVPDVARGEWWLDVLTERGLLHEQSVTVIEALEDRWYATVIDGSMVRQIVTDAHYQTCVASAGASRIVVVESSQVESVDESIERIAPPTDQELSQLERYRLTQPTGRLKPLPLMIGLGALLGIGALTLYVLQPKPQERAELPVTHERVSQAVETPPWVAYRLALHESVSAHQVMEGAVFSMTHLALLPPGWKTGALTLQGRELAATVQREPDGLVSVWQQWQRQHDSLA